MRLTLICGGPTAATRRAAFPLEEPLEDGAHARAARIALPRRAERIWTSPALSARQTAAAFGLNAAEHFALRDQEFGAWAGTSLAELQARAPRDLAAWLADPDATPHGGESVTDVVRRVAALMEGLLGERGHTLAVTHAAVIRAALLAVLGAPVSAFRCIDVEPFSIVELTGDGRRWHWRAPAGRDT